MIVDLTETDAWPREFDLAIEPAEIGLDTESFRLRSSVRASGRIEKHSAWFDVEGLIEADAEIDCSRCLEPIGRPLSILFSIRLLNTESFSGRIEKEVDKGDLDASVLEGRQIDLTEVVREQILLDLPEQVFCKEDCKGLCPECGANRNLIGCKCEEDDIDPRWAALKDLK